MSPRTSPLGLCLAFPAKGKGSRTALRGGKEWGAWGAEIWSTKAAHQPGFSVFLSKNVPVQKTFTSKFSLGPLVILITLALAGASTHMKTGKFQPQPRCFQTALCEGD
jgi:formate hydrogenlyase subunit 3/multisubunit Na+/H+ antiporter MnhD subunit